MKKNNILLTVSVLLLASACSYDTLPTYEDVDRVFFKWAGLANSFKEQMEGSSDLIKVNLGYDNPVKSDSTILIGVSMMGHVSGQDRPISAELLENESTAIAGQDIEILPSFIPAGKVEGQLAVRVKNSEKLSNTTLTAKIRLVPNEYFHTDYTLAYTPTGSLSKEKTGLEYNILFDAKIEMPSLWADLGAGLMLTTYFGTYSNVKLQVICDVCGLTAAYFMHDPNTEKALDVLNARFSTGIVMGMISQVNRYLTQYRKEHGEPLKDENGAVISMGTSIE